VRCIVFGWRLAFYSLPIKQQFYKQNICVERWLINSSTRFNQWIRKIQY